MSNKNFEVRIAAVVLAMVLIPLAVLAIVVSDLFWIPVMMIAVLVPGALLVARDQKRLRAEKEAEREHQEYLDDRAIYLEELLSKLPAEDREHARQMIAEREVQSERQTGYEQGFARGMDHGARGMANHLQRGGGGGGMPNLNGWGVPLAAAGGMAAMSAISHMREAHRHGQWQDWMMVRADYERSHPGEEVPAWMDAMRPWGTDEGGFYRA